MKLPVEIQLDDSDKTLIALRKDDDEYGDTAETGPAFDNLSGQFNDIGNLLVSTDTETGKITLDDYFLAGGKDCVHETDETTWLNIVTTINEIGLLLPEAEKARLRTELEAEMQGVIEAYRKAMMALEKTE